MRDIDEYESGGAEPSAGRRHSVRYHLSVWAGAACAAAVLGGAGWWAYGLGTRDASRVPVIAAMTGPVKERVDDESSAAPHQDIQAYAAAGTGAEPGETSLAPPAPRPGADDVAMGELEAMLGLAPAEPVAASEAPRPQPAAGAKTVRVAEATELAALDPAALDAEPEEAPAGPNPPAGEGSELAPSASPLVLLRPIDLARRMRAATEEAVEDAIALAERAAKSPVQIQLGAFLTEVQTREQWQLIRGTHAELLHNRALAIETTRSGGKLFYRLRVGPFSSRAEAASLCQALEARGQTCIVAADG